MIEVSDGLQWVIRTDVGGQSYLHMIKPFKGRSIVVWTACREKAKVMDFGDLGEHFSIIPDGFKCYEEDVVSARWKDFK